MSTKIYSAYEWHGSVPNLIKRLQKIRGDYMLVVQQVLADNREVLETWQSVRMNKYPAMDFLAQFKSLVIRKMQERGWDDLNFTANAAVYFYKDRVFVQFFGIDSGRGVNRKYDIKFNRRLLTDFHYQNSTDGPADVPRAEWEKREKIWRTIFDQYNNTCAESGLSFEFAGMDDIDRMWRPVLNILRQRYPEPAPET